jgi:hypothetical protein
MEVRSVELDRHDIVIGLDVVVTRRIRWVSYPQVRVLHAEMRGPVADLEIGSDAWRQII